jgi:hypothetical protein
MYLTNTCLVCFDRYEGYSDGFEVMTILLLCEILYNNNYRKISEVSIKWRECL